MYTSLGKIFGLVFNFCLLFKVRQGRSNQSGLSGHGQTTFSQGKTNLKQILQKVSNK